MTSEAHASTAKRTHARPERTVVCQECGNDFKTRGIVAYYCPNCRYEVKLRKQRERDKVRPKNWVYTRTCVRCGATKAAAGNFGRQPSGKWRPKCIECEGMPMYDNPVSDDWRVYTALTLTDAKMQAAGGSSPCYYCCRRFECSERNAALDDRPLPCFEGDE